MSMLQTFQGFLCLVSFSLALWAEDPFAAGVYYVHVWSEPSSLVLSKRNDLHALRDQSSCETEQASRDSQEGGLKSMLLLWAKMLRVEVPFVTAVRMKLD